MSRKWKNELVLWSVLLMLGAAVCVKVLGAEPDEDAVAEIAAIQTQMLERNNSIRTSRSLRPHKASPALMAAAQDHAVFMARTRVFSHYANGGPGGRASKHGFGSGVLENIGYGYQTVEQAFRRWEKSGGHYANITSGTSEAGFGLCYGADGTPYWCAVYGTPPSEPAPAEEEPATPANVSPETLAPRPGLLGWIFGRRKR